MKKNSIFKSIDVILFIFSDLMLFLMPIVKITSQKISLFSILKLYFEHKDEISIINDYFPELGDHFVDYVSVIMIVLALLIFEVALIGISKKISALQISIGSAVINAIVVAALGIYIHGKLGQTVDTANDLLSLFSASPQIQMSSGIYVVVIMIHITILAISFYGLYYYRNHEENKNNEFTIYAESISQNVNHADAYSKVHNARPESVPKGNPILDEMLKKQEFNYEKPTQEIQNGKSQTTNFYGGVIGTGSVYQKRVLLLKKEELITIGKRSTDIVFDQKESDILGILSYDMDMQEYLVKPVYKNTIFLRSGQPLGANRIYYLPRGMKIYILKREDMFELA